MDRNRQKAKYTIVRYMPDVFTGEVINIGLILQTEDGKLMYKFIDKENNKLKAFSKNYSILFNSIKNKIEYYLANTEGFFGEVGAVSISSPANSEFLDEIIEYFNDENIRFIKPRGIISRDFENSFNNLFYKYIGEIFTKIINENTKTKVSKIFEERNYIGTKIKENYKIKPISDIQEVSMKIDFVYKNGVWNYLQVVPDLKNNKQKLDFLAEIKLLYSTIHNDDKIRFIYDGTDSETIKIISYLQNQGSNVEKINLLDENEIGILLEDIENHANDNIEELINAV